MDRTTGLTILTVRTLIFVRGLTGVRSEPRPRRWPRMVRYENTIGIIAIRILIFVRLARLGWYDMRTLLELLVKIL